MEEGLLKKLMATVKCGVCGRSYDTENVDVVGHEEDLWFLKAFCPSCHTECLVAAVVKKEKAPKIPNDLTQTEFRRFANEHGPTADDLLDMHNFLKDFNGDFSQLFNQT